MSISIRSLQSTLRNPQSAGRRRLRIVASGNRCLAFALVAAGLAVLCSCQGQERPEPPLQPGTPVSGNVATADLLNIVYWPKDDGKPYAMPIRDTGKTITYRSAVPPGDYTVYAYITGARAKIGEVTVGQEEVHFDIPDGFKWEEAKDDISDAPNADPDAKVE